jgi:hypothetical protein
MTNRASIIIVTLFISFLLFEVGIRRWIAELEAALRFLPASIDA